MEFLSKQLEATSDVDIPSRSWKKITVATNMIVGSLTETNRLSLRIVSPTCIRALNNEFRRVDAATDVLSFPKNDNDGCLGDIALNWTAVCSQARSNHSDPDTEAVALITHGLLHLAGFTHETDSDNLIMTQITIGLCKQAGYEVDNFGH